MAVILNPYLSFKNNAREAITFYHSVFGGELTVNTFADFGASQGPEDADLVMHAMLKTPNGLTLMASDTPAYMEYNEGNNISISLSGDDEETLRGYYNSLVAGGQTVEPLTQAPWGDTFGMLVDAFGINWLFNIATQSGDQGDSAPAA
ncbi:VOC family protein [Pseudarthrobacter sp. J1738]|uniref:VOC family protein n=1 Tax=unclassified Pseudarthrobacter TaxID=2647000 RepID=UPI003D2CFBA4